MLPRVLHTTLVQPQGHEPYMIYNYIQNKQIYPEQGIKTAWLAADWVWPKLPGPHTEAACAREQ